MTRPSWMSFDGDQWNPEPPLPFYTWWWFGLHRRMVCQCGEVFKRGDDYREHWLIAHRETP